MVGTFAFVFDRVFKFGEMEGSFSFGAAFAFGVAFVFAAVFVFAAALGVAVGFGVAFVFAAAFGVAVDFGFAAAPVFLALVATAGLVAPLRLLPTALFALPPPDAACPSNS